jgi:hypothetical protein
MSSNDSKSEALNIEEELEDARRFLADEEGRRDLIMRARRRPQGWLQARSWRARQRLRGWLIPKVETLTSGDGR